MTVTVRGRASGTISFVTVFVTVKNTNTTLRTSIKKGKGRPAQHQPSETLSCKPRKVIYEALADG
jgi:hypothetical protein